jgi:hypothetical protein
MWAVSISITPSYSISNYYYFYLAGSESLTLFHFWEIISYIPFFANFYVSPTRSNPSRNLRFDSIYLGFLLFFSFLWSDSFAAVLFWSLCDKLISLSITLLDSMFIEFKFPKFYLAVEIFGELPSELASFIFLFLISS